MLDQTSVRIYRQFVYGDADHPHPIPEMLEQIHDEVFLLQRQYTGRSQISVDAHTFVYMLWKLKGGAVVHGRPSILGYVPAPVQKTVTDVLEVVAVKTPEPELEPEPIAPAVELDVVVTETPAETTETPDFVPEEPAVDWTPSEPINWGAVKTGTPVEVPGGLIGQFVMKQKSGVLRIKTEAGVLSFDPELVSILQSAES